MSGKKILGFSESGFEIMRQAAFEFGIKDSKERAVEEMAELILQIARAGRADRDVKNERLDTLLEIADVFITVTKLAISLYTVDQIDLAIETKLQKLKKITEDSRNE